MKTAIISLFFLIIIFTALQYNVLSLLRSDAFHYASYAALVIVIGCAVYFVGVKRAPTETSTNSSAQTSEDTENEK